MASRIPRERTIPEVVNVTHCFSGRRVDDSDEWSRTATGDVRNLRAFNRHMDQVGEEDQSQPGWDGP